MLFPAIIRIGIDPVLVRLGPIAVHWYGVMYVVGICAGLYVALPYAEQLRMWAKVNWLSNEGVRINSIIADAGSRLGDDTARHALFNDALGGCDEKK